MSLDLLNKNAVEIIYDNFKSFVNGYIQSNNKNERYDNIIKHIDYLQFYKLTRDNIIEIDYTNIEYCKNIYGNEYLLFDNITYYTSIINKLKNLFQKNYQKCTS